MKYNRIMYASFFMYIIAFSACKKQNDFLDAKPNQALNVPSTLADCQSLLLNEGLFNSNDPALGEIGSDDLYVTSDTWSAEPTIERNSYLWAKTVYEPGQNVSDWSVPYQQIYYANTVLETLMKIKINSSQQSLNNQIEGSALFFRSIAFYNLLQTFSLPYDPKTSKSDLGIPLKLSSNPNIKSPRATVQECYNQMIKDLVTSISFLPGTPAYKTQPCQASANALLARLYLAMGDYKNAFSFADGALKIYSSLQDFNAITPQTASISTTYFKEDIFHSVLNSYDIPFPYYISITDSTLYKSYNNNDLRKSVFFIIDGGVPYFRGTYDYLGYAYSGIATDELYLIRAECNARLGNTSDAIKDLNTLLVTRWKAGTFIPFAATDSNSALLQILIERRKELLYRGLRWNDLRRLNKDPQFSITLKRVINGVTYTLPPNDPRYAWPIPDNELQLNNIPQNNR
ncbi:RagB/SusD family nutrient uptake outer membrane protein [Mucilaginibacter paludis]|uniref:RagB/SusD domain-containing protein n=1 Tax=Mucilaginibacter paludis DSM 18603 TaxID=714943 RepID=H1YHH9_9SPHI|nr:RagB/SusD family nutrient uptake outer membrane protein [Mucilaginibacter paludis]EHQ26402.1 hypothetical protein Mucpa_2269 [Mucilaginibacter paludis DSM 18603]